MKVWDSDGKEFLDFYGGHAVSALGYGHPALTKAIDEQVSSLIFQSNAASTVSRQRAVQALVECAPEGLDAVFLVNSGSEANENALRLAFSVTGRQKVIALKGSFHGRTAASAAVTDGAHGTWYGFPSLPFPVEFVEPGDPAALDEVLTDEVAAFIFEPVQGVAGAVDLPNDFVTLARQLCHERGVLMIADEVQTGIGRTGTMFACSQYDIVPDIMTLAKGLGGGFPVAAVLARQEFCRNLRVGSLGTTFGGGPVACAAICAVLDAVSRPGFLENVREMSTYLQRAARCAGVERISGKGLLLGLDVGRGSQPIRESLYADGVLVGDSKNPNVLRLLPPLILDRESVNVFGQRLARVLS